ncbi:MAG: hypothetical protein LBJ38_00670 [Oscillospiraceae bacterium]|jgi:hypothetical protein|nr:hypothetical protein [Oscillospiraceae bacterium]
MITKPLGKGGDVLVLVGVAILCSLGLIFIPVRLDFEYEDEFTVQIRYLFFKKKMHAHKYLLASKPSSPRFKSGKKIKRVLAEIKRQLPFWKKRLRGYCKIFRWMLKTSTKVAACDLKCELFVWDMAVTGWLCGLLAAVLSNMKKRKGLRFVITPGFVAEETRIKCAGVAYVWVCGLCFWLGVLLFRFFVDYFKAMNIKKKANLREGAGG